MSERNFMAERIGQLMAEEVMRPHQEMARSLAAELNPKLDDAVQGLLNESHIAFGAACSYQAYEKLMEHNASFELRWRATMRGIEKWREAHPGNDLVMPDHADFTCWLIEQLYPEYRS